MINFKEYYDHSDTQKFDDKWETVLFTGEYSPITRNEYTRIIQFCEQVVSNQTYKDKFSEDIELGLVLNSNKSEEKNFFDENRDYKLNEKEIKFINEKFFGLKTIPINLTELLFMVKTDDKESVNETNTISKELNKRFHNSNILIVLRPEEKYLIKDFQELVPKFVENNINIGFMTFEHEKYVPPKVLRKTPCSGNIIKSIVLLDALKPHPEGIKLFAHKYKVQEDFNYILNLRNKFEDNYEQAFSYLFPPLTINENESNETKMANVKTVMEFLKRMYLKNQLDEII